MKRNNSVYVCNELEEKLKKFKEEIAKSKSMNHYEDQEFEDARIMGMEYVLDTIEQILYN